MDRRAFLKRSLIASAVTLGPVGASVESLVGAAPKRILVLGGTLFLGPALVQAAVAAGHTVTLFNRGITNPELFPHLEKLRGFRSADSSDQDLSTLSRRHFDAIVDVWPNDPTVVASAAEFLKDHSGHYLYVSSVAAYDGDAMIKPGLDESSPMNAWDGPSPQYNRGKAESERRLHAIFGDRITIVRPGPIKGERDDSSDLYTWLVRAQAGGRHIAPGDGNDPVELVDVKDVARFLIMAINQTLFGTFNLAGRSMRFFEFLGACQGAMRSDPEWIWIPKSFLDHHGLETAHTSLGDFPFWRSPGDYQGIYQARSDKAFAAGWATRPFEETAWDCLSTFRSLGETGTWSDVLPPAKEREVLDAWMHRAK